MLARISTVLTCFILMLGLTGYSGPIPPNAPPPLGPESELTTVGPDEYGYLLSDDPPDYAFEDISLTGNTLFFSDTDNGTAATGIVPFPYYDQVYSLVYVNVNGFLSFTDIPARKTSVNKPLPTDSRPNNLVAAYWSNIILGASGKVLARNETAPNRTIIQWNNVTAGTITGLTFEIILFADGDIRIVYQPVSGSFTGVTAGIEDADGVSGLNYAIPSLISGESVLISRPEKVTGGVHVKARPQVSSNFFTENEAWFTVTISNTTTSALASDAYFLDAEVLESDPANPPLPPLNWDLEFYSPDCSSVIPSIPALAKDTSTQLCMRVLAGDGLIPGDYVRMKVTVTSQADSNRSSIIYLQATIGSPFAQLYQDSASGLRLDFTNGDGQTSFEMANPYGGSHMAMNMLRPNHYIISWLEGSSIKYRMIDKYPGKMGSVLGISASPDDIRNLIDLTPAVAGSRDGYAGILYIVNKYQTNGLGHTELNANVWFALMNPDGSMVKNEEGDDMYPLNMTNNTAYLDLVTGYSGDAIPQFQDPRIVPVGPDKMGLVWRTNYFPAGGSSMDKIDYVLAKTDGSDYSYWEIPGWDTSHRHIYPATTYLDDGRFMITYTNYTGASNPWVIYYSVIDSDGLATSPAPVWSSGDTNGWQVDLVQLGNGRVLLGWQDISTSAITYAVMDNSLTGLVADPVTLVYNDYPGHTNYRAGGYPSVTRSANGNGIITWQDQDWQEQLYYALIGPDGDEITPPSLYRRVGSTLPESQISTNDYGNAPYADWLSFIPLTYKDYIPFSFQNYFSAVFK